MAILAESHMRTALALAARGLGNTWPNPAVGCVLVRDGLVVGRGWTQPGGRPHAEAEALARAGDRACGATAYVTLEPCSHHGKTPPCAGALIKAGVARVVVACGDSDPRVAGRGIAMLRAAGITVAEGVCEAEALALNEGFFRRIGENRPLVTLKTATTLDGRIASATGASQWITGDAARAWGHRLRASHDAILVGINTALADDPELTCRLPGLAERSPVRVVLDSQLRLSADSRLVRGAGQFPIWIITVSGAASERQAALRAAGAEVLIVPGDRAGYPAIRAALAALAGRGITRLMVEGGAGIAAALLRADLVDRLEWFRAGALMGADGLSALGPFGVERLADMPRFALAGHGRVGADLWESWHRQRQAGPGTGIRNLHSCAGLAG